MVDRDRYALNQATLWARDLGPTDGFGVLSLNGGWKIHEGVQLTAGVDNLLDETHAEQYQPRRRDARGLHANRARERNPAHRVDEFRASRSTDPPRHPPVIRRGCPGRMRLYRRLSNTSMRPWAAQRDSTWPAWWSWVPAPVARPRGGSVRDGNIRLI
ncbi:MAG: TonB-dependent receptor [Gammaproteobacteria bacterium]|nr:TonB-dependent receptor [Gammaproteobacteria bacterium]